MRRHQVQIHPIKSGAGWRGEQTTAAVSMLTQCENEENSENLTDGGDIEWLKCMMSANATVSPFIFLFSLLILVDPYGGSIFM